MHLFLSPLPSPINFFAQILDLNPGGKADGERLQTSITDTLLFHPSVSIA